MTSAGPVTYRIRQHRLDDLEVDAWGPGADELVDHIPAELGAHDHPEEFRPAHPVLDRAWRRLPGLRVPRTGRVFEALVPAILEQRVVNLDAQAAWTRLLRAHGTPAPGSAPAAMRVMPHPEAWAKIPIWDWRRAGVDLQRSRTVVLARHAGKLERAAADPPGSTGCCRRCRESGCGRRRRSGTARSVTRTHSRWATSTSAG
ncbi:MAG TPA: hypothetical protein VGL47_15635 [Amycolatopsis sp.]|uniref:DNA-3-methyladenine glycosylase family protein n=1 Tax=Amycolatopsis sp. TaxID=37632 RepID=UPI002F41C12C